MSVPAHHPIIDKAVLAERTFGDDDLARELLGLFAAQCEVLANRAVDEARPNLQRADAAHTLKGAALAVGALVVADLASRIEERLRSGGGATCDGEPLRCAARGAAEAARRPFP